VEHVDYVMPLSVNPPEHAISNPGPVEKYLENEMAENRVIGSLPLTTYDVHMNQFGVIPKCRVNGG
jgi:hypothetical protein